MEVSLSYVRENRREDVPIEHQINFPDKIRGEMLSLPARSFADLLEFSFPMSLKEYLR